MTPTTLENLRNAILSWVFDITGRELALANAGQGAKERSPYCEVFISQYTNDYRGSNTLSSDGLTETISSTQPYTIALNLYGNNPMQDAGKLARSLYSAKRYLDLWKVCGLSQIDSVQDLTALETGAMKQRALLEFIVNANMADDFVSDFFDSIPIEIDIPEKNYTVTADGGSNPRQKAAICNT